MRARSITIALSGYAVAITVVFVVAVVAIRSLDRADDDRVHAMRNHELRVTFAERLRWRSELKVAAGRGYVITGDVAFREKLDQASASFKTLARDLRTLEDDPAAIALLARASRAAAAYDEAQDRLRPEAGRASSDIVNRFERELLPAQNALSQAIDAYVERHRVLLEQAYAALERDRVRARTLALWSIGVAAALAAALFWATTIILSRSRRVERDALASAEAALAARDEMLGVVAHDLRNPLSVISLKAELLRETSTAEKTRRTAESIQQVSQRMEELIRSLLDVAVIEAGRFSVAPVPCDLAEVVRDACGMFEGAAQAKAIALAVHATTTPPVMADRERVSQVLSNLIGNAVKFTPEGGRVRIEVRPDEEACAVVEVIDTGPGIAPGDLDRLFDRYWKRDRGAARGTGLGLFIARAIIEAHGGRIWAESRAGSGATFAFRLPRARATTTSSVDDSSTRPTAQATL
jgi:signal transduction histidine kinase